MKSPNKKKPKLLLINPDVNITRIQRLPGVGEIVWFKGERPGMDDVKAYKARKKNETKV